MSRRRSARIVVATAGVVGVGSLGLLAAPAIAATPTVTYTGGCGLAASTSEPSDDAVSTPKTDGTGDVIVVNDLGASATPYANGNAVKDSSGKAVVIKDGSEAKLGFASGPVELTLVPVCLLDLSKQHEAATITVTDPAPPADEPGDQPGEQPGGGNPGTDPDDGDAAPGQPNAGDRPLDNRAPVARGAVPPEGSDGRVGSDEGDTNDDAVAPPASGDDTYADNKDSVNPIVKSNDTRGPGTTTLALIAAVCLLGVGVAALRTIVMGRATRVRSV